jgi:hypothetical protein
MSAPTARQSLFQIGIILIGGAALAAQAAWLHMRAVLQTYGVICGFSPASPSSGVLAHCPACYVSLALFVAGAAALVLARADRPTDASTDQSTQSA